MQSVAPLWLHIEVAHSDAESSISSPAPVAGHITETHPAANDALSFFGEQDIDEGVNQYTLKPPIQRGFLMETAIAKEKPTGPTSSEHLTEILIEEFHIELELAQRKGLIEKFPIPENCTVFYFHRTREFALP